MSNSSIMGGGVNCCLSTVLSDDVLAFFNIGRVHHRVCLGVAGLVVFGVTGLVMFGVAGLLGDGVANLFRNLPVLDMTLGKVVNGAVFIRNLNGDLVTLLFRSEIYSFILILMKALY